MPPISAALTDLHGVTLAAVQGLNQKLVAQQSRIQTQEEEIASLKESVAQLQRAVAQLLK